eukprot:5302820-Pleurochrysis_carterae.AAC.2
MQHTSSTALAAVVFASLGMSSFIFSSSSLARCVHCRNSASYAEFSMAKCAQLSNRGVELGHRSAAVSGRNRAMARSCCCLRRRRRLAAALARTLPASPARRRSTAAA